MGVAIKVLVGDDGKGLSASTVFRLKRVWADEYRQWQKSYLAEDRWVYIWADGIYYGLRDQEEKLCALVIIGVNEQVKRSL
jgi:putative transposase